MLRSAGVLLVLGIAAVSDRPAARLTAGLRLIRKRRADDCLDR